MNEIDSQPVGNSQPRLGPGDRLQSARISIGMTLDDVARKMHLSSAILTSLEQNNFEEITAPIFVKGYLRAYSRLVNIDEEEIIQQYSIYYMDGDPPISTTSNTSPEINADDSRVRWITYIVILGLIALLTSWWWNRYQQAPETVSLDSGSTLQSEVLVFDEAGEIVDNSLQNNRAAASDSGQDSLQHEIKSVVDSLQLESKQAEEQNILTATVEPEAATVEKSLTDRAIPDEVLSEVEKPVIQPAQQNNDDLVIIVNADTWASIKDASGNKLVYSLLYAGKTITVSGKAPIKVFFGNGYGVTMKYKGKDIDLSGVIQPDNTARIKLGQ